MGIASWWYPRDYGDGIRHRFEARSAPGLGSVGRGSERTPTSTATRDEPERIGCCEPPRSTPACLSPDGLP